MKKGLAALLVLFLVLASSVSFADFDIYPNGGCVIEVNYDLDLVTFIDGSEHEWCFYGAEDWGVGDLVACLIWDAGTQEIFDDEILDVTYIGYVELFTCNPCPCR